jgi:Arylsulfatase A and related enzymes
MKLPLSLLAFFLSAFVTFATAAPATSRPNFIVIVADDLGWGDISANGHPHIRTPHIDRLATEGIRFTSCYSTAPVCSPSRVGLLTGRNPNRAGIYEWIANASADWIAKERSRHLVHMRRDEVTLPRLLQRAGYATAMSGKWHCNSRFNDPAQPQPGDAGFDHWFATQNNAAPSHLNPINFVRNGQPVGRLEGYSCQIVANEAITWLDQQQREDPSKPFFLYVAFHEPHEPVASPPDLVARHRPHTANADQAEYFANVENMDRAIGQLLDTLDRLQLAENTLVLFTSDNGPEATFRYPGTSRSYGSPGPLRGMKLWTTEAGSRVPGVLRWPGHVQAGQVTDEPFSALDLLPTFCALAQADIPTDLPLDGADFRPSLNGQPIERARPLFWVYFNAPNDQRVALRDGPWKLLAKLDHGKVPMLDNITTATAPRVRQAKLTDFSLYNLASDLGETRDLSQQEPERVKALSQKLDTLYRDLTATMHIWPDEPLVP